MKEKRLTLFIADDHPIFRRGLCEVIAEAEDLRLIGQASTGDEALKRILELRPGMAILDVNMPGMNGLEVAREVLGKLPATKIILLTLHEEEDLLDAAIDAGILAYVLKDHAVDELVNAIHAVVRGKRFISQSISGHLLRRDQQKRQLRDEKPGLELLTSTERRILKSIADDNTSKEIADLLGISVRTVETHRQNISNKLNLSGTHSLVKFAFQHKSKL